MSLGVILLIGMILLIVGLCVWFFIKNRDDGNDVKTCTCSLFLSQYLPSEGKQDIVVGTYSYECPSAKPTIRFTGEGTDILKNIRLESDKTVHATILDNNSEEYLYGKYILQVGDVSSVSEARQSAADKKCDCTNLVMNTTTMDFGWYGGSENIEYTLCGCDNIEAVKVYDTANWVTVTLDKEKSKINVKVTEPNLYDSERETPVNIIVGGTVCRTITVVQEKYDEDIFDDLINYFQDVVNLREGTTVYNHLKDVYTEAKFQYVLGTSSSKYLLPSLYSIENFPYIYKYYGTGEDRERAFGMMCSWLFTMVLSELVPDKRDTLYQMGYNYQCIGKEIPTYGFEFDSDVNVARMVGSAIYAATRDESLIDTMRKEVGGSTITYKNEVDEIYVNLRPFMPQAPGPYLKDYDINNRTGMTPLGEYPGGYPVGEANSDHNLKTDKAIHDYIVDRYSLDSKNKEYRQRAIQAIADKESCICHCFGEPVTVHDDTYGDMTFNPVFGKHNIGITISKDGAIAKMIDLLPVYCSKERNNFLRQQYGRIRPGQGSADGTCNPNPKERILCNYTIEESDGCPTGYYNMDGDYVNKDTGTHIGDYCEDSQRSLYANSYPSGHSAFIWATALILIEIMPDRADRIMTAATEYAVNRTITRFHWNSDTIHGRVVGSVLVPIEHATTNFNYSEMLAKAKEEYRNILKNN